jgi:hypothetical protein
MPSWWLSFAATALEIGIEDQRTKTATREDRKWPVSWVGVVGFEPAASSSRSSGAAGRLAVVPASRVCRRSSLLAAVRGRCCTSVLYGLPH